LVVDAIKAIIDVIRVVLAIVVAMAGVFGMAYLAARSAQSSRGWGFDPVDGTPRIEFRAERDCWRYLSKAKKINLALRDVDCTQREVPLWGE
jgi:hypothetical protein